MHRLSRKLFGYFVITLVFFSSVVLLVFPGILEYQTMKHHEMEMKDKIYTIKNQLEDFICKDQENGKGAYLKYLDDVTLAEVYVVRKDNRPFTCGKNPESEKIVPYRAEEFAMKILKSESYLEERVENIIYAGIPIKEDNEIIAALVIVESLEVDEKSFLIPILVLGGCLFLALIVSAFLSMILVRRFMKPIHRIAEVTKELAAGNYMAKTNVFDQTEIGVLAKETDILAGKLMEAQNQRENMEQMQKDYIANVSHELRTPVAVIRSSLEAINDQIVPEEKKEEYQRQILQETISLQRLINDMLELSRLENSEFKIEKEKINVIDALNDAVRGLRLLAKERNIVIEYEKQALFWEMYGDYGRIRQMFVIVLENAIKYSEDDSKIVIETIDKKADYYISIKDEGCGIADEQQKHIFDKFYRVPDAKRTGTGLGLVIVKNIAKRHGIEIRINSRLQAGTKVTFIIQKHLNVT